jgi:hypothetical protein
MNLNWEKRPSLAQYDKLSLEWPSVTCKPSMANREHVNLPQNLIGDGETPSFPNFGAAFNAFMYDDFNVSGTFSQGLLGEVSVRFADQRARIRRVRIRPTSLDVWVGGRSLEGCRLELNGVEHREVLPVVKVGRITIVLPDGLPTDAWLKHGTEWLDYRALNNWANYRSADIEEEIPHDIGAELSRLATQGEGQRVEYKSQLPTAPAERRHVFKTVVAFANGEGAPCCSASRMTDG